jgi:TPR repeat protein
MAALNLAVQCAAGTPYGLSAEAAMGYAETAFSCGEAYAGHLLGTWFEEGQLVQRHLGTATMWYERAAAQGSQLSCLRLAAAYLRGELDVARDAMKGAEYLKRAEAAVVP